MAKLPFVVEPRRKPIIELIGTEESGQFEMISAVISACVYKHT